MFGTAEWYGTGSSMTGRIAPDARRCRRDLRADLGAWLDRHPWLPVRVLAVVVPGRSIVVFSSTVGPPVGHRPGRLLLLVPDARRPVRPLGLDRPDRLRLLAGVPAARSQPIRCLPWQAFMAAWTAILLGAVVRADRPRAGSRSASCWRSWSSPAATSTCCWPPRSWSGSAGRDVVVRPADQDHARHRAAVVRGPARVAEPRRSRWARRRRSWPSRSSSGPAPGSAWGEVLARVAGRDGTWAAVPIPFVVRLPFAVALVVWGAWTGRRWTVPVAGMLALPALWYGGLSMLLAVHRAARERGAVSGRPPAERATGDRTGLDRFRVIRPARFRRIGWRTRSADSLAPTGRLGDARRRLHVIRVSAASRAAATVRGRRRRARRDDDSADDEHRAAEQEWGRQPAGPHDAPRRAPVRRCRPRTAAGRRGSASPSGARAAPRSRACRRPSR